MAISSLTTSQLREFVTNNVTKPLLQAHGDVLSGRPVNIIAPSRTNLAPELDRIAAFTARGLADGLKAEMGSGSIVSRKPALPPLVDELAASRSHTTVAPQPIMDWHGSDVLVTGASSGLGRATAEMLAARGARVFAVARRKALLDDLEHQSGGRIIGLAADVSNPEQVADAVAQWRDKHGGKSFRAVIHAAGGGRIQLFKHTAPTEIQNDISTNVLGALLVTRETLPFIADGGRLAIVTSGSVFMPWAGGVVYVTGKSATYGLARALADHEAKDRGVTVTAVTPGAFDSELWGQIFNNEAMRLAMNATRPAFLPSAKTTAATMLNDIAQGLPVSSPGAGAAIFTRPWASKLTSQGMRHMTPWFLEYARLTNLIESQFTKFWGF